MASAAAFAEDTLAVLVLYNRELADSPTFRSLDAALEASAARLTVLVQDNSARPAPIPDAAPERWVVHARHDASNPGVSAAYRAGAELAARLGKRWLLFLDQDTVVPGDAVTAYARAAAAYPDEVLLAPVLKAGTSIVSPCAYRFLRGTAPAAVTPGRHALDGMSVLNSGMCVRRAAYEAAGGHDARIPLDFSDHEFVSRLRTVHDSFAVVDATFTHGLSAAEPQSRAQRLARFRAYCRGATRVAPRGARRAAAGVYVLARAALLAWRWRHPAFLAVPFQERRDRG